MAVANTITVNVTLDPTEDSGRIIKVDSRMGDVIVGYPTRAGWKTVVFAKSDAPSAFEFSFFDETITLWQMQNTPASDDRGGERLV